MEYYIALLVLVIPGFLVNNYKLKLSVFSEEKNQFRIILNSLINNIVILIINYYIISWFPKLIGIDISQDPKLILSGLKPENVIKYFWLTCIVIILLGPLLAIFQILYGRIINKIRGWLKLSILKTDNLVWDEFTQRRLNPGANGNHKVIEVIVNGEVIEKGRMDLGNTSDGGKEFIITDFEKAKEFEKQYSKLDCVYVDADNKTIIKVYCNIDQEEK